MNTAIRRRRLWPAAAMALAFSAGAAQANVVTGLQAMAQLQPPASYKLVHVLPARGVQIYECRVGKTGGPEWSFVAPQADLYGALGRVIGHHGAGPYWEARDGSRIEGKVVARADAPGDGAIPWLLLETQSSGPRGAFSRVTSVQRVNTEGGTAPALPCTVDTLSQRSEVAYSAEYRFYAAR